MKFVKLASFPTETDEIGVYLTKLLAALEDVGETFYYDSEAHREVILITNTNFEILMNTYYEKIGKSDMKLKLESDFLSEADRVFLVIAEDVLYAVSRRDVGYYLDMLISKLELANMR